MKNTLKPINTNLDLGSDFLTPQLAYFLGGISVGEIINIFDNEYWICLVRHNPGITSQQLEHHFKKVKYIASYIGKQDYIYMYDYFKDLRSSINGRLLFSAGKKGFLSLFKQNRQYNINTFVHDIKQPLINSDNNVLKSFIIGIFDTKGSYDKTLKKVVVDVRSIDVADLIMNILDKLNISYNYNPPRAKDRKGVPRFSQIRINYYDYVSKFGYLSIQRLDCITSHLDLQGEKYVITENKQIPLEGLKLILMKEDN